MKLTTNQLKQIIKEELSEVMEAPVSQGTMSINQYLKSVDYDVDPTLLDLLVSLNSSGLEVSDIKEDRQNKIHRLTLTKHGDIIVSIFSATGKVYLSVGKLGSNKLIQYDSHSEAAGALPLRLDSIERQKGIK